jgi:hypothetical protein
VEILGKHCDLLGSSILSAVEGKDIELLPVGLKDSIGRLVMYVSFSQFLTYFQVTFWLQGNMGHFEGCHSGEVNRIDSICAGGG